MKRKRLTKQFNKHRPCYYCGAQPPSSREHAPIRAMFDAFDCSAITVPSCEAHNNDKNLADRAILSFFMRGLYYSLRDATLTPNVLKALAAAEKKLTHAG